MHIIFKVSDHLFCPFVACLLIALENNSFFIKFLSRQVTQKGQTRDPNALIEDLQRR